MQRIRVFTYLQIHVCNWRLAFGSLVLIKTGKSMGLCVHLFLGLIKLQEEIKTQFDRKPTKVGEIFPAYTPLSLSNTYKVRYFIFLVKRKDIKKSSDWFCFLNQIKYFLVRALITAACRGHGLHFLLQMVWEWNVLTIRAPFVFLGRVLLTLASAGDAPRFSRLCLLDFYLLIRVLLLKSCQHFTTLRGFLVFYCLWTAWGVVGEGAGLTNITFI